MPGQIRLPPSLSGPQWSPSGEDGTTHTISTPRIAAVSAAMEPVRRGRDDPASPPRRSAGSPSRNGARPERTGRLPLAGSQRAKTGRRNGARPERTGRHHRLPRLDRRHHAAMEPVRRGRDDPRSPARARTCRSCRNGARPERTGRLLPLKAGPTFTMQPQWSPSGEDGTTVRERYEVWDGNRPQWSPSGEDGTTIPLVGVGGRRERRNGARPERTGRPGNAVPGDALHHAAMEPVRRGRDDTRHGLVLLDEYGPQWSPSGEDGTTASR